MPSNHVSINNAIDYYVVDDKMDELMEWLNKNARPPNTDSETKQEDIP